MGYFEKDMEEMLDVYLLEANQLLEQSETILINAEKEQRLSSEDINGIFRAMHTIKSSSAMMGLSQISTLAHCLEDLFSVFREDPSRLRGFEQETFDLIFDASDFLKAEMGRMRNETYSPLEPEGFDERIRLLVSRVRDQQKAEKSPEPTEQEKSAESTERAEDEEDTGYTEHTVRIMFEKDCRMENIRALMVLRQVKDLCEKLVSRPENLDTDSDTAEVIRRDGFYITFAAEDPVQVIKALQQALFVETVEMAEEEASGKPEEETGRDSADETEENVAEKAVEKPAEKRGAEEAEERQASSANEFINVRVERLDDLQNLTGELIIASSAGNGEEELRQLNRLLKTLESLVISIRMVPFSWMVPQIHRIVRDICRKEQKEVTFTVSGEDVEIDKKIADCIIEPLQHLIRNAVDHGIEPPQIREAAGKKRSGAVSIAFESTGGEAVVTVCDDGCGMDLLKIRKKAEEKHLIDPHKKLTKEELLEICLLPGFSTRETAGEYSGRGVGLDVVRQMVEDYGGHMYLTSEEGKGSCFSMHLPLTLAIVESVRLRVGQQYFAIPSRQVLQFLPYEPGMQGLQEESGREYWIYEDTWIPVIHLRQFYKIPNTEQKELPVMLCVNGGTRQACLVADHVVDSRSLVQKPLPAIFGSRFKRETGISGFSILGDGSISMQLDVERLIRTAGGKKNHE